MEIIGTEPFSFENRPYEIRIYNRENQYQVRAFIGDVPANGYAYSVSLPEADPFAIDAPVWLLVETAKQDIRNKVWERYLADRRPAEIPPAESLCMACGSARTRSSLVDQRTMTLCMRCNHVQYAPRTQKADLFLVQDAITAGVDESGSHTVTAASLDRAFTKKDLLTPEERVSRWAIKNRLKYRAFRKNEIAYLRFYR